MTHDTNLHLNRSEDEGMRDTGTELLPEVHSDEQHHAGSHHQSAPAHQAEGPIGGISGGPVEPPVSRGPGGMIAAVVVCLILAVLIYMGIHARAKNEKTLTKSADESAIPTVQVTNPSGADTDAAQVILPANVTAFIDTPIYARTSGYLKKWYYDIGARVQKGALLAQIETPELDQQVLQAQQDVKTAESNLQIAQTTATRWEKLLQKNAVSHQEADQTMSDLAARKSTLGAQQANLMRLQQMQGFEKIYAPFSGVITARNVDIGSLIEAGQNTTQKELFHLASTDRLRVFVPVPEVYQSAVHDGARVEVSVDAFPNDRFYGTLARNSRAVDPLSRTLNVEVDVNNTTGKLLPGAYAFVHLDLPAGAAALRLPSNTLLFRSHGLQVGVVNDGKVELRSVKIGHDYGATVEITDGLKPSDEVIVDPSDSLESGDMVHVEGANSRASNTESSDKKGAQ